MADNAVKLTVPISYQNINEAADHQLCVEVIGGHLRVSLLKSSDFKERNEFGEVVAEGRVSLVHLVPPEAREHTVFTVPTYHPNQPTGTEEYGAPHYKIAACPADGLKLVLGTEDWQDLTCPDVQIERRHAGWAIFLHAEPGGDVKGMSYFMDDGRSYFQLENFSDMQILGDSVDKPEGLDLPPDPKPGDDKSHWADDPKYTVKDWQYEVSNGDTRLGYAEWVKDRKEQAEEV